MNLKQIQYALKLSEVLNISQVAEQFNISQPALSKQILSLEKEVGVQLFDRSSIPMTLTPAGEYFFKEWHTIIFKQDQLMLNMNKFKTGEAGRLVIGISPFRSLYVIPQLVKKINEKYPEVQIFLNEYGSEQLRREAAEGKYDFAIVNLPVNESVLDTIPLEPDTLALVVPNNLLDKVPFKDKKSITEDDFKNCSDLPFIVVTPSQEMRHFYEYLCDSANISPKISMEVVGLSTAWSMAASGLGATILPLQFINSSIDENVTLFKIQSNKFSRQPSIVIRKGQYLSEYAKYAIKILTENF